MLKNAHNWEPVKHKDSNFIDNQTSVMVITNTACSNSDHKTLVWARIPDAIYVETMIWYTIDCRKYRKRKKRRKGIRIGKEIVIRYR